MGEQVQPFLPNMSFEEYQSYYADRYEIHREDGICEIKMHTDGAEAIWDPARHCEWGDVLRACGNDIENEVIIITNAGTCFKREYDAGQVTKSIAANAKMLASIEYELTRVQTRLYQTMLTDVDVPVICALNGPGGMGGHMEFMILADICLCTPDVVFGDGHFSMGAVPGGGALMVLQEFIGEKRANWLAYTGESIDAKTAEEWGLVSEVVEREALMKRAWELARDLMKQPRSVRRMTHDLMRVPLREKMDGVMAQQARSGAFATLASLGEAKG